MVVAPGGDEERARVAANGDVEAERAGVEGLGRGQVADVQVDMSHAGTGRHAGARVLPAELAEHAVEVEWERVHLQDAVADRPPIARAVAVELDAVALGVAQVESLADQVVGGARQAPAGLGDALQGAGEIGAARHHDREVEEAAGAARPRRRVRISRQLHDRAPTVPIRSEANHSVLLAELRKPDCVPVEAAAAVGVGDRQAHGPHRGAGIDRAVLAHEFRVEPLQIRQKLRMPVRRRWAIVGR